jgi:hypothetical protein
MRWKNVASGGHPGPDPRTSYILNEAGDRADGVYYFWTIKDAGGSYEWQHVMTCENGGITPN